MKILSAMTMLVVAVSAWAGEGTPAAARTVRVCSVTGVDFATRRAQPIASGMFATAGIRI
jgi:hypothetical protein